MEARLCAHQAHGLHIVCGYKLAGNKNKVGTPLSDILKLSHVVVILSDAPHTSFGRSRDYIWVFLKIRGTFLGSQY